MKRCMISLPLLLLLISCGPADLQKTAQGLNALSVATFTAQTTIIQMEKDKVIDTDTTRDIMLVIQKCFLAQKQAISITRTLTKIDKPTQQQLILIMKPVTQSIKELVENGTAGIKNPETKEKVLGVLVAVQSVLTAINIALGV